MKKAIALLLLAFIAVLSGVPARAQVSVIPSDCFLDCRPGYWHPLYGYIMNCQVVCPTVSIIVLPDGPAPPNPSPCNSASVNMNRITMKEEPFGSSSVLWPTQGRWGNTFEFEGRALFVGQNPFEIKLTIRQDRLKLDIDISDVEFDETLATIGNHLDGSLNWNLTMSLTSQGERHNIQGPDGSVTMRGNEWHYEKTKTATELLMTEEYLRKDACYEHRTTFSQTYQASWSFGFSVSSGLLANFGVSESYTQQFQDTFILPRENSASVLIDTLRDRYSARRYRVDWLGLEDEVDIIGPLYNTYKKVRVQIHGPCFN